MFGSTMLLTVVGHTLDTARVEGLPKRTGPMALMLSTLALMFTLAPPAAAAVEAGTDTTSTGTTVTFTLVPEPITLDRVGQAVGFGWGPTHLNITHSLTVSEAFTSAL